MKEKLSRRCFLTTASAAGVGVVTSGARAAAGKAAGPRSKPGTPLKAGLAKVEVTPRKMLWMAGFAARNKTAEGTLQPLYAKALALEDATGKRAVLVTSDLIGFPAVVSKAIASQVEKQYGLSRDRLLLSSSHTHSGPVVPSPLSLIYRSKMSEEQWRDQQEYARELESKVVAVVGDALKDLRPARLRFGHSEAKFAVNRRQKTEKGYVIGPNPEGPVDHDVPFLRIDSQKGQLRGVVFGYACHATVIGSDSYVYCGDYPGFAQQRFEKQRPGAMAMFMAGCGADQNAYPRGTADFAQKYGDELAGAVDKAMSGPLRPVGGSLQTALDVFPIAFVPTPSREELEARLKDKNATVSQQAKELLRALEQDGRLPTDYPYTVQVWQFGRDLTLIAMAGEVVVDYALRLKKELGSEQLWVAAYSNEVPFYVPSLRVLQEGGYEGGEAMRLSRLPGPFAPTIEETIVGKVHELVKRARGE